MITHIIYHLPGIKVGCCKDLEARMKQYPRHQTRMLKVLEELHDTTDQEAGDVERRWSDHFGYRRYVHYAQTVAVAPLGASGGYTGGRIGGPRSVELGVGVHALTKEQRASAARKTGGFVIRDRCPHCGFVGNLGNLHRYHLDNCPHKKQIKFIITRPDFSSGAELPAV